MWNILSFAVSLCVDAFLNKEYLHFRGQKSWRYSTERKQSSDDGVSYRPFHVIYIHSSIH